MTPPTLRSAADPESPLAGLRILFVDDAPDERDLFQLRFMVYGAEVVTADSVDAALWVLDRGATDVVVTEWTLPNATGLEFVRRARDLGGYRGVVPFVLATAYAPEGGEAAALAGGFAGVVRKPYEAETLVELVAQLAPLIRRLGELRARAARRDRLLAQQAARRARRERLVRRRAGSPARPTRSDDAVSG